MCDLIWRGRPLKLLLRVQVRGCLLHLEHGVSKTMTTVALQLKIVGSELSRKLLSVIHADMMSISAKESVRRTGVRLFLPM